MEKFAQFTAIGRPVDPRYPTNRAIAIITALVIAGGTIFQLIAGEAFTQSLVWGLVGGLAVFLSWALGREIDPDHDYSAFVAAGLSLVGYVFVGAPSLAATFWVLLILRVVNRSVGVPISPFDSMTVFGFGGWMAWQSHWLFGMLTAAAFFLDAWLHNPLKRHWIFGGIMLAGSIVVLGLNGFNFGIDSLSSAGWAWVVAAAIIFIPVIRGSVRIKAVGDLSGEALNGRRIQAAQLLALVTVFLFAPVSPGITTLLPLWSAIIGVGIYRLVLGLIRR